MRRHLGGRRTKENPGSRRIMGEGPAVPDEERMDEVQMPILQA
jgi:hypothetical protein